MRIISNFHDYYDSIMSTDDNRSIIYKRIVSETQIDIEYPFIDGSINDVGISCLLVGFAGNFYPCFITNHIGKNGVEYIRYTRHAYSESSALENIGGEQIKHGNSYNTFRCKEFKKDLKKFFETRYNLYQYFAIAPIFIVSYHRYNQSSIIYNSPLRNIEFYKILGAYTAYTELRNYYENQAQPMKPIPEVSDEVMQEIKGFDHKYSFRKEPKK